MASSEAQIASIRSELEIVQKALKLQTKRCRQLVTEYTLQLQQKDLQYQNEKALRDNQLAKVLRALIIFESRLKQEQKFISHQLKEKDYIIHKQSTEIKKLLANQYCKNCNQYYSSASPNLESLDSSSEYVDSSSDLYASISTDEAKGELKLKMFQHRTSFFEVLNDNLSDLSGDEEKKTKISESIPVFEGEETNNNWYASASDPDDDEQRDLYRNNPVLECMNQILLQNINSPPKTPNTERKSLKKVKFEDEETKSVTLTKENVEYYETPIQKIPNFYETPQSVYSNDYEQILSKSESFPKKKPPPPALPPKPANLTLKFKPQKSESAESEPDYCSISELNLPPVGRRIAVVAEINPPNSQDVITKSKKHDENLVKKCVEKINMQLASIPKLPQVSEILIPDEEEKQERISHDNYVKNNSQILKNKKFESPRRSIVMGTSVSSLISGFNNQTLSEIRRQFEEEEEKKPDFDLSQNFEEFKLDECEIEEYNVDEAKSEDLDASSVELKTQPTYEHFLECTGLSSKAILTPSRLLSNHKSMLKPKDIKLRSKVKANLYTTSTIKYWSEPYI
ncbi:putative leucine-rich repeat-containing protein DDB_G0290503 isoform X2 [Tribolium madens]|nr:putative leucine-rich repeat-containing protein DDB_G0290503 isoform X2 [Tribolium madens]XP_044262049.1 putative leucine-rich repeat-containing protein DDB_G0290503 isoform X2 [Tribolium madens]